MKNFPGARLRCIPNHVKLSLRDNSNHISIHVRTNNLSSNKTSEQNATVNLFMSRKSTYDA